MVAWIIVRRLVVEPYIRQQKVRDIERHRAMHHSQYVKISKNKCLYAALVDFAFY